MLRRVIETDAHEGPVWVASERALYFTTQRPEVQIRRLADGEVTTVRATTGVANGMTLDHDGTLLVCEQEPAAITRLDLARGCVENVVDAFDGRPLNSPNDVVVSSDRTIWFTDPSYAYLQGFGHEPQLADSVYRFDPATGDMTMVGDGFDKPNGLALSPDERILYVGDNGAPEHIRAFDLANGAEWVFAETPDPDGLKVDPAGNVFVSSPAGVRVLNPEGVLEGEIPIPGAVNFALAGDVIYITADDAIWAADIDSPGGWT